MYAHTFVPDKTKDKDIMSMDNGYINGTILADKLGVDPGTMRKRIERTYKDVRPVMSSQLSNEQAEVLAAMSRTKGRIIPRKPRTAAPKPAPTETIETPEISATPIGEGQPVRQKPLFNSAFLKAIIYGHAVLVLADLTILYSLPGAIAGVLVGLFMHSATELADRPELNRTSQFALSVCFVLDALAWFVHVPAFRESLSADVSDIVTQVLSAVVCAMSFAALYVVRDSKLD